MQALLGQKKEQTQKFRVDGKRIPVTVVEINNNAVIAVKTADRDGYVAVQLGIGTAKKPSRPLLGHIKGAKLEKAPQFLKEVKIHVENADELPKVGDFISIADVFEPGDVIDVTGTSKGKGFAGGVKRYHFKGGPATHGQSDRHRAPGSIGAGTTPGRVYKGKRMAGKMGFETVTVKNLTVAGIDGNLLYIAGLIPGMPGAYIIVKKTEKKDKKYADLVSEGTKEPKETNEPEGSKEEVPVQSQPTEQSQSPEEVKTEEAKAEEPVEEKVADVEVKEEKKEEAETK